MSVHLIPRLAMRYLSSVPILRDLTLVNAKLVTLESKGNVNHGKRLMTYERNDLRRKAKRKKRSQVIRKRKKKEQLKWCIRGTI